MSIKFKIKLDKPLIPSISSIPSSSVSSSSVSSSSMHHVPKIDLRHLIKHSPNESIIKMLNDLIEVTEKQVKLDSKIKYRLTTFKKALSSIKDCSFKINSGKEAMVLDGVGKGISERIDEYIKTGTLKEFDTKDLDDKSKLFMELQEIHGIGSVTANNLIDKGIISIPDLLVKIDRKEISVPNSIKIGLKYNKDFKQKIPYDEIKQIFSNIKDIIFANYKSDQIKIDCCGSHRRQKLMSGDIDILITHPCKTFSQELPNIIKLLTKHGILIDHLTELGLSKYMGVCVHPDVKIGRRIDIRFIDYDSYYYAMLYFTGNVNVNKEMRTIALSKNMTLNEYSLFDNLTKETFIVKSEKEIFDILNILYLEPHEREL